MLSQVEAAAVTDEVSLMAVPANRPKLSPLVVSKPRARPSIGKKIAASTLKKKMTEIACATSSSSAPITGAVAAIAEPPQIEEPTPTRIAVLPGMRSRRQSSQASNSAVPMVHTIIGSDWLPVFTTTPRFMPKPSSTTANCSTIFEVKRIPAAAFPLSPQTIPIPIPSKIAITAPPITGNRFPMIQDGTASARQTSRPLPFFCNQFMLFSPFPPVSLKFRRGSTRPESRGTCPRGPHLPQS